MQASVSVCIANYNGVGIIDDCLRSVLEQDCTMSVEILVHDDASTDYSAHHIRANYPRVTLIESAENAGFCIANNRMVARATGEFVLLLNNDALLYADALSTLYQAARNIGTPAILTLPQYRYDTGELLDIGSLVDPFLNPVPNKNPLRSEVAMVMGACLWIPKALWTSLGGFPEWFGSIGEDLFLCSRARLVGHPVRALGTSGYRHRVGSSFGGGKAQRDALVTTRRRRALSERNKTFVIVLTYPSPVLQFIFPVHILLLLLEGGLLAAMKRDWSLFREIYLASVRGVWLEKDRLSALRQELQEARCTTKKEYFSVFDLRPHKLRLLKKYGIPQIN